MHLLLNRYSDETLGEISFREAELSKFMLIPADRQREILSQYAEKVRYGRAARETELQRYCRSRRKALYYCLCWRRVFAEEPNQFFLDMLRDRQRWLTQLRQFYRTGEVPRN